MDSRANGFAAAVQPLATTTIHTDDRGLWAMLDWFRRHGVG